MFILAKLLSIAAPLSFAAAWAGNEQSEQELVLGPVAGCPTTVPLSCRNTTVQHNLCCFEAPGVSAVQDKPITAVLITGYTGLNPADPGELNTYLEHGRRANETGSSGMQSPAQGPPTHGLSTASGLISDSHSPLGIPPLD